MPDVPWLLRVYTVVLFVTDVGALPRKVITLILTKLSAVEVQQQHHTELLQQLAAQCYVVLPYHRYCMVPPWYGYHGSVFLPIVVIWVR